MSEALKSLLLDELSIQSLDIGGDGDQLVPRYGEISVGQEKPNWCWAAVGAAIYNLHVSPQTSYSQSAFALKFGSTINNVPKDIDLVFKALEAGSAVPEHERLTGAKLLDHQGVWNKLQAAIAAKKPVPLGIAWNGSNIGHMICVLGTSSIDGEHAIIVYDPSEFDEFPKNLRRIKFNSSGYMNFYRGSPEGSSQQDNPAQSDNLTRFDGYISIAFIP